MPVTLIEYFRLFKVYIDISWPVWCVICRSKSTGYGQYGRDGKHEWHGRYGRTGASVWVPKRRHGWTSRYPRDATSTSWQQCDSRIKFGRTGTRPRTTARCITGQLIYIIFSAEANRHFFSIFKVYYRSPYFYSSLVQHVWQFTSNFSKMILFLLT